MFFKKLFILQIIHFIAPRNMADVWAPSLFDRRLTEDSSTLNTHLLRLQTRSNAKILESEVLWAK